MASTNSHVMAEIIRAGQSTTTVAMVDIGAPNPAAASALGEFESASIQRLDRAARRGDKGRARIQKGRRATRRLIRPTDSYAVTRPGCPPQGRD